MASYSRVSSVILVTYQREKPRRYSFSSGNAQQLGSWRKALSFPSLCFTSITRSTGTYPFWIAWKANMMPFSLTHEVEVNPVNSNLSPDLR